MGMMGMFKWLRKDVVQRERNGWNLASNQYGLNNESYRNALQAFIDRRRFLDDAALEADIPAAEKNRVDVFAKNNNNKCGNEWKPQDSKSVLPGVPHVRASEIFEIGCVSGTDDKYLELIFAEWQNTRVALKRHTHPECKDAVKADLDVLSEIRHPNVLLLMATTQTDDHGLVSIFESVDCTLYNYIHEQGERISVQGIAKIGGKLADALRHSHMRGYIHGAISSHCVYLASNGIVKLGGWELAVQVDNPKPEREYEERLRAEIFRWQAPELFYGCEPRRESDVYGLTLLIWEMCTTHVPWSGCNRADVERQYVHWKRSVIIDLYEFPPLLNNLLEAGLQIDVTKRTLDMNRMRRFLQRLEMQYEDKDPVYIDHYSNNNNESEKTCPPAVKKSPTGGMKKRNTRLARSASVKQLACTAENPESPKHYTYQKKNLSSPNTNLKVNAQTQQVNLLGFNQQKRNTKDNAQKSRNMLFNKDHKKINPANNESEEWDGNKNEESGRTTQPWNSTYRKVQVAQKPEFRSASVSVYSNTSPVMDSTDDDDSYRDARANLKELRKLLANRREHFFYGNDSSSVSLDTSPRTRNRIFTQARSKDYEPHKPASHKTSLEPKCNKSPGQYDSTYLKTSSQQYQKLPCSHVADYIKNAIMDPHVLNSESQSFFESSLWRKEKLICISKMRKTAEQDDSTFLSEQYANNSNNTDAIHTQNQFTEAESLQSGQTYVANDQTGANDSEPSHEARTYAAENTSDSSGTLSPGSKPLRVLKDALDRATEIVRSVTPNTDASCQSPPFKSYESFEASADERQACRLAFEDMYGVNDSDGNGEIRSIERPMNGNNTYLLGVNSVVNTINDTDASSQLESNATISSMANCRNSSCAAHNFTYTKSFVCDSIFEVSGESSASCNNSVSYAKEESAEGDKETTNADGSEFVQTFDASNTETENYKTSKPNDQFITQNLALKLLNDSTKYNNCNSCQKTALPRRRSLPAALGQLRALNNTTLGKLPIRKADMPENTVEDLYIDDEFGDCLNINMILLEEEILLDEDFLPDISEL